ncbi:hypothetical protein [Kocuria rosea]|nr:hypothetical protein [Kocuria rosea]WJZ68632.1 hypothetical protein QR564_18860 [Kocuria rosea]
MTQHSDDQPKTRHPRLTCIIMAFLTGAAEVTGGWVAEAVIQTLGG